MTNPITELRDKRKRSRRAPMPVSQKPRRKRQESRGPNPFTPAGTLLYSLYEAAMFRMQADRVEASNRRVRRTTKQRPAGADSREAKRRVRQGAHLHQHPSVVERFKNHPTRAQIETAAKTGLVTKVKRALSPRCKPAAA